jgi:hypothetical protein
MGLPYFFTIEGNTTPVQSLSQPWFLFTPRMAVVQRRWCEARRLLAGLQPDTAESVIRESVVQASDVVDRRQAAPHTQRRLKPTIPANS